MSDPRLSDLGDRIAACMKRHGFTERELILRSLKRQLERMPVARVTYRVTPKEGRWVLLPGHGAE